MTKIPTTTPPPVVLPAFTDNKGGAKTPSLVDFGRFIDTAKPGAESNPQAGLLAKSAFDLVSLLENGNAQYDNTGDGAELVSEDGETLSGPVIGADEHEAIASKFGELTKEAPDPFFSSVKLGGGEPATVSEDVFSALEPKATGKTNAPVYETLESGSFDDFASGFRDKGQEASDLISSAEPGSLPTVVVVSSDDGGTDEPVQRIGNTIFVSGGAYSDWVNGGDGNGLEQKVLDQAKTIAGLGS